LSAFEDGWWVGNTWYSDSVKKTFKEGNKMTNVQNIKTTAQDILREAKKEAVEAKAKDAKEKIKSKLKALDAAKLIVANLERELEVLVEQVNAELNA